MNLQPKRKIVLKKRSKPELAPARSLARTRNDDICLDDVCLFPLIDLRSNSTMVNKVNVNTCITEKLQQLIDVTRAKKAAAETKKDKTKHSYRIRSFTSALNTIRDHDKPISSKSEAMKLDGIGKGIGDRIQEILRTGTLAEIEETISPESHAIMDLCRVTGIGEARAMTLVDQGITGVDDLIEKYHNGTIRVAKNQLTKHIAVGLKYYHDINERFLWDEANDIVKYVTSEVTDKFPELKIEVCGSYRRHKETCGDIDVLICHPELQTNEDVTSCKTNYLSKVVNHLTDEGFIVAHLTDKGKTKFMGVASLKSTAGAGRRIDIRFIEANAMGAAMLYFTGSGTFNKIMRYIANERGFTLNEYGLYHYHNGVKCDIVPTRTERDIFRALKFKYLEPWERDV